MKNFFVAFALLLTACAGYTPLYQTEAPVRIGQIAVSDVEKNVGERRIAQMMRQELSRRFPGVQGDTLSMSLERNISDLAVREDATVERSQYTLEAKVTLTSPEGELVWRDTMKISATYSIEDTPLSTDVGKNYAARTAAIALSDEIARRVHDVYRVRNQK